MDGKNAVTNVAGNNYTYDGNGNLTGPGFLLYDYDAENQLVRESEGKGHPLGLMSTGKKVFVPNMFFIGLAHYCPESPLRSALSEPVTSSFDSGR